MILGCGHGSVGAQLHEPKARPDAMSRANIPAEERVPFYMYVDEFQNFATDSFSTILSEARKYGLYLTVANQYVAQMMPEVKDAVLGNVGSIVTFRISADDARTMQRYFDPKFSEHDLIHMHNRYFIISMTVNGEKSQAFSGITLDLPALSAESSGEIIASSRQTFGNRRDAVEQDIKARYEPVPAARKQALANKPAAKPVATGASEQVRPTSKEILQLGDILFRPHPAVSRPLELEGDELPPRRKRRRRRSKNHAEIVLTHAAEREIKLR